MKKILFLLPLLFLVGCKDVPYTVVEGTSPLVEYIDDYGSSVDNCRVRYIHTNNSRPNFWMVSCPHSTTTTQYETGGKSSHSISATTDAD